MTIDERLKFLNLELPPAPKPVGSYVPVLIHGKTAYISGQVSRPASGQMIQGKVGKDLSPTQACEAAKVAALNVISLIREYVGWDRFDRVLRVAGFVNVDPAFSEIPQVMNGASDLFKAVFGDSGVHARAAVGVANLPMNAAVEIEVIIALK